MASLPAQSREALAGGGNVVDLPPMLHITDVHRFAQTLGEAVARGDLVLDAARLQSIDTAGIQLLCATRTAVLAAGRSFGWAAESAALRTAAGAAGLRAALGLDA
ncbi:MAG: STAS domain-containing protein [Steroidobacteraceae bacterium]|nr:STAS domain-containing protein [Nevskiaceae bacterium]MCP5338879.1 STAS domain-containing protein [Nevskiaceae bacterium]MCP5360732.1 STAS domain-containing protein [Nevskiaceae bacterium]MCP5466206.1 STAS domain-containing protein [Nevskiaceae bacterium]MCP5471608.1 STAS domain-containing protein [Nevskiaceae bacterium]